MHAGRLTQLLWDENLHMDALKGRLSNFNTTLGTQANRIHKQVLTGSSRVRWVYVDKEQTIQVAHCFVPFDDSGTATCMGAQGDGIQETTCVKFPHDAFECVLLTVIPKNKLTGLRTWENNNRLPDSSLEVEAEVGPGPLDHDGNADTLPYFLAIPYLQPVLGHVPIGHPVTQPLPDGDYNAAFAGWFAGDAFLCLKHNLKSAHVGTTIFAASNWTLGRLVAPIVNGISSGLYENMIDQLVAIMAGGGETCNSLMSEACCDKLHMFRVHCQ